jgi:restriction system protein
MPVPDYQSLFLPVLQVSADRNEHSMAELRERIAAELKLTPEDLAQKLPSGKQSVFTNRIAWAVVYLAKALALDRVKRGVFRITKRGGDFWRSIVLI